MNNDLGLRLKEEMEKVFLSCDTFYGAVGKLELPKAIICYFDEMKKDYFGLFFIYSYTGRRITINYYPILYMEALKPIHTCLKNDNRTLGGGVTEIPYSLSIRKETFNYIYNDIEVDFKASSRRYLGTKQNIDILVNLILKELKDYHIPKLIEFTNRYYLNKFVNSPINNIMENWMHFFTSPKYFRKMQIAWLGGDQKIFEDVSNFVIDYYKNEFLKIYDNIPKELLSQSVFHERDEYVDFAKKLYTHWSSNVPPDREYLSNFKEFLINKNFSVWKV